MMNTIDLFLNTFADKGIICVGDSIQAQKKVLGSNDEVPIQSRDGGPIQSENSRFNSK